MKDGIEKFLILQFGNQENWFFGTKPLIASLSHRKKEKCINEICLRLG